MDVRQSIGEEKTEKINYERYRLQFSSISVLAVSEILMFQSDMPYKIEM